jgi:hypothetical protein
VSDVVAFNEECGEHGIRTHPVHVRTAFFGYIGDKMGMLCLFSAAMEKLVIHLLFFYLHYFSGTHILSEWRKYFKLASVLVMDI